MLGARRPYQASAVDLDAWAERTLVGLPAALGAQASPQTSMPRDRRRTTDLGHASGRENGSKF